MAYFPVGYQPAQIFYPQQYQQQMTQPQQTSPNFVRVQNENEARMYPVAPGNSVMFIDENSPYCYTKTMDISQLDRPKFDKYRLVKEEEMPQGEAIPTIAYAAKSDLDEMRKELDQLKEKIAQMGKKRRKYEEDDDE